MVVSGVAGTNLHGVEMSVAVIGGRHRVGVAMAGGVMKEAAMIVIGTDEIEMIMAGENYHGGIIHAPSHNDGIQRVGHATEMMKETDAMMKETDVDRGALIEGRERDHARGPGGDRATDALGAVNGPEVAIGGHDRVVQRGASARAAAMPRSRLQTNLVP